MPMAAQDEFLVRPRYLAGAGEISRVLQPLVHVHCWPYTNAPATRRLAATSPCGRIEVAAEIAVFHLWRIRVRSRPSDAAPLWQATFTRETPVEIVGALVQALAADRHVAPEEIVAEQTASPTTAWRPLLKAGWTPSELTAVLFQDPDGTIYSVNVPAGPGTTVIDGIRLSSPDGTASLAHEPKPDDTFGEGVGPWEINVAFGPASADRWTAVLSAATPVRYLNMLTSAVVDPAPVIRTRDQVSDATRAVASVRPAPQPRSRSPFPFVDAQFAKYNPRHPYQGHPRR
ncbi:DUF317 domain-containing protein [Peterkaempfera bronchialis]|uniref:DUF317 domain-containing protein n=1 Tax=Peterkaempfera bronchialis TaxID=2126346 RepID=UPI003C301D0A